MSTLVFSGTHFTKRFHQRQFEALKKLISESDKIIINGDFWEGLSISFDEFLKSEWNKKTRYISTAIMTTKFLAITAFINFVIRRWTNTTWTHQNRSIFLDMVRMFFSPSTRVTVIRKILNEQEAFGLRTYPSPVLKQKE